MTVSPSVDDSPTLSEIEAEMSPELVAVPGLDGREQAEALARARKSGAAVAVNGGSVGGTEQGPVQGLPPKGEYWSTPPGSSSGSLVQEWEDLGRPDEDRVFQIPEMPGRDLPDLPAAAPDVADLDALGLGEPSGDPGRQFEAGEAGPAEAGPEHRFAPDAVRPSVDARDSRLSVDTREHGLVRPSEDVQGSEAGPAEAGPGLDQSPKRDSRPFVDTREHRLARPSEDVQGREAGPAQAGPEHRFAPDVIRPSVDAPDGMAGPEGGVRAPTGFGASLRRGFGAVSSFFGRSPESDIELHPAVEPKPGQERNRNHWPRSSESEMELHPAVEPKPGQERNQNHWPRSSESEMELHPAVEPKPGQERNQNHWPRTRQERRGDHDRRELPQRGPGGIGERRPGSAAGIGPMGPDSAAPVHARAGGVER